LQLGVSFLGGIQIVAFVTLRGSSLPVPWKFGRKSNAALGQPQLSCNALWPMPQNWPEIFGHFRVAMVACGLMASRHLIKDW
jgi:hypothetical protein